MLHIRAMKGANSVFNIGPTDEGITVREIAERVRDRFKPGAKIAFGKGNRGWVGYVSKFRYSVQRLLHSGRQQTLGSYDAAYKAVDE